MKKCKYKNWTRVALDCVAVCDDCGDEHDTLVGQEDDGTYVAELHREGGWRKPSKSN